MKNCSNHPAQRKSPGHRCSEAPPAPAQRRAPPFLLVGVGPPLGVGGWQETWPGPRDEGRPFPISRFCGLKFFSEPGSPKGGKWKGHGTGLKPSAVALAVTESSETPRPARSPRPRTSLAGTQVHGAGSS